MSVSQPTWQVEASRPPGDGASRPPGDGASRPPGAWASRPPSDLSTSGHRSAGGGGIGGPVPRLRADYTEVQARFGELWLKGHNRTAFVQALVQNVRGALARAGLPPMGLEAAHGRLVVRLPAAAHAPAGVVGAGPAPADSTVATVVAVLAATPGLTWVQPVVRAPHDAAAVAALAVQLARLEWGVGAEVQGARRGAPERFAVRARRSCKSAPLRSEPLAAQVGAALVEATGLSVDLRTPHRRLYLDVGRTSVALWTHQVEARRGLPVGTAGTALVLLSGGFDSVVAGHLAQGRGCRLEAVHFFSPPFVSEAARLKVQDLAAVLAGPQGALPLHIVPFTAIQVGLRAAAPDRLQVVLARRFMYRIADALAAQRGAAALCAGESLGQVASQTLENLAAVDAVTTRSTLRPLVAWDKHQIIDRARQLGTYDISARPAADACGLFAPQHPATRAPLPLLARIEAGLPVADWVAAALAGTEVAVVGATPAAARPG